MNLFYKLSLIVMKFLLDYISSAVCLHFVNCKIMNFIERIISSINWEKVRKNMFPNNFFKNNNEEEL